MSERVVGGRVQGWGVRGWGVRAVVLSVGLGMGLGAATPRMLALPHMMGEKWTVPTAEELAMTGQKEVPGAAAVYLFREENTDDQLHMWSVYERIKILNEKGKEYANVELRQRTGMYGGGITVGDISGRTIHADGSIVAFTGKPYEKLIVKGQGIKFTAKVFTLPDVQVGSIVEYRYTTRYDDNFYIPPQWYVQKDLFTRKAHYRWAPTSRQLILNDDRGQLSQSVAWTPMLPPGMAVKETVFPQVGQSPAVTLLELDVTNIAPAPVEEYMPPLASLSYRVLFYYAAYRTTEEFWKSEGKHWSKVTDKFVGPGPLVAEAVQQMVAGSDTQEQKLKKLYAAVMGLENTDFTRSRSEAEDKGQGGITKTTDELWAHKRANSDQMAALFVAMARAAGMKAYVMRVSDREQRLFVPAYLVMSQLDDAIAIVNVDGKERYFDPGSRYCGFGHLAWQHTGTQGLRQVDGGASALTSTPGESYMMSRMERTGDLAMDRQGGVSGTLKVKYIGAPALHWRQVALRGDETSLNRDLRVAMEEMLPKGIEVKVASVQKLVEYDEPLVVTYEVKGDLGAPTGRRMLLPGDPFLGKATSTFPHEAREMAVLFPYAYVIQDAVRVKFPAGMEVESVPATQRETFKTFAAYSMTSDAKPDSYTVRRNFTLGEILYPTPEYPGLRGFYTKMENKDQEGVVLKRTSTPGGN